MAVGSNVNPNFPVPGIDQDSRGFRDNFATIKQEIENIQSKTIQLVGGVVSDGPVIIDSSDDPIVINTTVLFSNVGISGNNYSLVYNNSGILTCSDIYFDSGNARVGINTSAPRGDLDLQNEIYVGNSTISNLSDNLHVVSEQYVHLGGGGNVVLYLDTQGLVGVGKIPTVALDVQGDLVISGNLTVAGQPTITGSRGNIAALANLLTELAARGLIIDNTSI